MEEYKLPDQGEAREALKYLTELAGRVTPPPPFINGDPRVEKSSELLAELINGVYGDGKSKVQ